MPLGEALEELQELTRRLRRDCPWDREQTARTIVPHTVEEAYEVADAAYADEPAKVTPLKEVQDSIRQQLAQTKKNEAMTKWVEDLKKDYKDKIAYQVGYAPPATTGNTTTATQ